MAWAADRLTLEYRGQSGPDTRQALYPANKIHNFFAQADERAHSRLSYAIVMYFTAAGNTAQPQCCKVRSEEHTSELQSRGHLVCRLLLEKKKKINVIYRFTMTNYYM